MRYFNFLLFTSSFMTFWAFVYQLLTPCASHATIIDEAINHPQAFEAAACPCHIRLPLISFLFALIHKFDSRFSISSIVPHLKWICSDLNEAKWFKTLLNVAYDVVVKEWDYVEVATWLPWWIRRWRRPWR